MALSRRHRYILFVSLAYAIGAGLWILLSDALLVNLFEITAIHWLSTVKGLFFVVVTSLLLFVALRAVPDDGGKVSTPSSLDLLVVSSPWPRLWQYLFAVLASLALLAVRVGLAEPFGEHLMLIMFMLPIILSAGIGGLGPGLVATLVCALGVDYFAIPPTYSWRIADAYDLFQWCFLIGNGLLVSGFSEVLHRLRRQTEAGRLLQAVTLASIGEGVITTDAKGGITFLNAEAERLTGWSFATAMGLPLATVFTAVSEQGREPVADPFRLVLAGGEAVGSAGTRLLLTQDGREVPIHNSVAPIRSVDGRLLGVVLVIGDDTARHQAERQVLQANRTLRALSQSNLALLHAESEEGLLATVCDLIVKDCGYTMVWIGMAKQDAAQSVRPVAWAGFQQGYIDALQLTWADSERGRGPAGTAIRTGRPTLARDILTDPNFAPWREQAVANGYRSMLSLPLIAGGTTFGAMSIYAPLADAFSEAEVGLLAELATDLAQGIATLRLRAEHMRVAQELRRERDFAETLIETAPAVVLVLDPQGRIVRFNTYLADLSGWSLDEVGGQDWFDTFLPAREREGVRALFQAAIGGARTRGSINVIVTRDGREREIEWYDEPLKGAAGRVIGLLALGLDVTERRQAEAALRQSEKTYRSLFTNMLNSVVHCRVIFSNGRPVDVEYLAVNPAFAEVTGISEPVVGRRISEVLPGYCQENPESLVIFGRVAQSGEPARWEHYLASLNRWFSFSIYSPAPGEAVIVTENISERKKAELALKESERRFRDIAEVSADWIWEVDAEGRYTFASKSVQALLGYTAEELIGKTAFDLMPPAEAARVTAEFAAIVGRGEPFQELENINQHKDGSLRHVLTSGAPIRDANGTLLGYRGVDRDVTASRQAEQELLESLAEKVALLKEVHHRVKNNLQIVASLLSLQADRLASPEAVEALRETRSRVRSMALLHEALYRSGNLARVNLALYVNELCAQILRSFGQTAARVRLTERVAEETLLPLEQAVPCGLIINELVTNALKHGFPDERSGEIRVELGPEANGQQLCLRVTDTGVGLPAGLTPVAVASTLGMQLVVNLAGQLGGRLVVEPPPTGGAGFRIVFPLGK